MSTLEVAFRWGYVLTALTSQTGSRAVDETRIHQRAQRQYARSTCVHVPYPGFFVPRLPLEIGWLNIWGRTLTPLSNTPRRPYVVPQHRAILENLRHSRLRDLQCSIYHCV